MQRSPIDLSYIVYDPPTQIITLNSNTGILITLIIMNTRHNKGKSASQIYWYTCTVCTCSKVHTEHY